MLFNGKLQIGSRLWGENLMYQVSVIILFEDDFECLESIHNQTLKDIELICIGNVKKDISSININFVSSLSDALNNINGEYILFIGGNDSLHKKACELLYGEAKSKDLDLLFVPIANKNHEYIETSISNEDFLCTENSIKKITPFNFTQFYKKEFLQELNVDSNIFYQAYFKSNSIDFVYEKLYFRHDLNPVEVSKYAASILNNFENAENYVFLFLISYFKFYQLDIQQKFYKLIKTEFSFNKLKDNNLIIYNFILKNAHFLDFLSEYMLYAANYDLYLGLNSEKQEYKISVVIPIYNNEKLIHRTLMSIENQSIGLNNIEVLMINDASTDKTSKVINEYADKYPNFKAIHIKEGTGSAGTPRNIGLKLASADYVMFIDHDDFFEINALEKLYEKIIDNNCDFVYGTYAMLSNDKPIKFIYPNEKHGFFKNLDDNNRSIITPPSIWTKLFKKEFLLKNNILFPTVLGEDAIFVTKALKNANGVYYLWDDIICYYNLNVNSFSSNLSYTYFIEGFASEEYLFELCSNWNHVDFYEIRGQGILDFYINRFIHSNLDENEIKRIFPLFYEFCHRLYSLDVFPNQNKNKIIFNYVIEQDVESLMRFKNYEPSKFKQISNKILNRINKHSFW